MGLKPLAAMLSARLINLTLLLIEDLLHRVALIAGEGDPRIFKVQVETVDLE